jgi:hypothetical protein
MSVRTDALTELHQAFVQKTSADRVETYVRLTKGFPEHVLRRACIRAIEMRTSLPSVADLLSLCRDVMGEDQRGRAAETPAEEPKAQRIPRDVMEHDWLVAHAEHVAAERWNAVRWTETQIERRKHAGWVFEGYVPAEIPGNAAPAWGNVMDDVEPPF